MSAYAALSESIAEAEIMARLAADFALLFPEMSKPDPLADTEASEGVCGMEEET